MPVFELESVAESFVGGCDKGGLEDEIIAGDGTGVERQVKTIASQVILPVFVIVIRVSQVDVRVYKESCAPWIGCSRHKLIQFKTE